MALFILASLSGVVVLASVIRMLGKGELRRRSAALWLGIGLALTLTAFARSPLDSIAGSLHVRSGADLALALALALLLSSIVHVSGDLRALQGRSNALASELRRVRIQAGLSAAQAGGPSPRLPVRAPRAAEEDRPTDLMADDSLC